jgi:hypothetical protein
MPNTLAKRERVLKEDRPRLVPGDYSLVSWVPCVNPISEDVAREGLRCAVLTVAVEAGKPTALKVEVQQFENRGPLTASCRAASFPYNGTAERIV